MKHPLLQAQFAGLAFALVVAAASARANPLDGQQLATSFAPGDTVMLNPQPLPPRYRWLRQRLNAGDDVMLNPQPLPPGGDVMLNPQPLPPGPGDAVSLNPQPLPPRIFLLRRFQQ